MLYRYFDTEGRLLYVGITSRPSKRRYEHSCWSTWWRAVASHTEEWYETRDEARAAEIAAIHAESPIHNTADTPAGRPGGSARLAVRPPRTASPGVSLVDIRRHAARYRRTGVAVDAAQRELVRTVVAALRAGARPVDVAKVSGWDRNYVRRLLNEANASE